MYVPVTPENKIQPEWIDKLMSKLTYSCASVLDTTTTTCVATLHLSNGHTFVVAVGTSGCIDPANFNAALGEEYARKDAEAQARNFFWKAEGYRLFWQLFGGAA